MRQTAPVYYEEFIKDIPWESNPMLYTNDNMAAYYAAIRLINRDQPIETSINYDDTIWNYNLPTGDTRGDHTKIARMENCPEELYHCARFFQIHKLERKKKPSSICLRLNDSLRVLTAIMDKTEHKTLGVISTDDIIDEITSRDAGQSRLHSLFESLYQFYYFLEENCRMTLPVNCTTLKKLGKEAMRLEKATVVENKWPNIPEAYFDIILKGSCRIMRDSKAMPRFRAVAASIVLLSQLGIRLGDMLDLKVDSMFEEDADGLKMHYINYTVEKLSKPHAPKTRFDIFASPLAVESFNVLLSMRKHHHMHKKSDILILLPAQTKPNGHKTDGNALPRHAWRFAYGDYMLSNFWNECHMEWEGIRKTSFEYYHRDLKVQGERIHPGKPSVQSPPLHISVQSRSQAKLHRGASGTSFRSNVRLLRPPEGHQAGKR